MEKRGPILCICYTNHALDSFLHHLYSIGITEIVRCGSGCKEDELKSFELNTLIKTVRVPRSDSDWDLRDRLKISSDKLDKLLNPLVIDEKNVSNVSDENFSTMVDYFYNNHGKWSNDLFNGPDVSREEEADLEEGYQKVDAKGRKKKAFVDLSPIKKFSYWLRGEDLDTRRHIIRDTVIFEQENLAFMQNIQNSGSKRSKKSKKVSSKILSEEEITKEIENRANLPYSNRDVLELLNFENETNFFEFSKKERCKLHDYWVIKNIADVSLTFCDAAIEDDKLRKMSKIVYQRKCLDVLSKAKVVGMTTTCVAKMQDLVKSMKPEIIICEEAGEVLESHVLTSLHSQAQHLIMIGDHLQLRPKVGQYKLSVDSKEGKNYRLDESLFERLVTKNDHRPEVPMSILRVQRRMRSDISDLIRSPLYPDLVDGENTKIYPDVTGMSQNVFFLDHRHLEDGAGKDSQKQLYAQSSKSNQFECDMIIGLVKHLVKNGYQPGDIAILTPYLGQVCRFINLVYESQKITSGTCSCFS